MKKYNLHFTLYVYIVERIFWIDCTVYIICIPHIFHTIFKLTLYLTLFILMNNG